MKKLFARLAAAVGLVAITALVGPAAPANAWRPGDLALGNVGSVTVRICWSLSSSTKCNMAAGTANLYPRRVLGPDVDAVFCGAGHKLAVYQNGKVYVRYTCHGSGVGNNPGNARLIKIDGCAAPCQKQVKAYRA